MARPKKKKKIGGFFVLVFHLFFVFEYVVPMSIRREGVDRGLEILKRTKLFFFFLNLFIYFWRCWVFVSARGLSLVAGSGGYSLLERTGFSSRWLLLLRSTGSRACGLQ